MNDIKLDENLVPLFANGDFVIGDTDKQNQDVLLVSEKGSFKENPDVGVGLFSFLEAENPIDMMSEIRRQFTNDGMTINQLQYTSDGKLIIDAKY